MRTIATLLTAAALLAACSNASDSIDESRAPVQTSAGSTGETAAAGGGSSVDPRRGGLELGFGEFAITLEASTIRPGPVTFVVRNGGTMIHGFEIEAEDEGDDDEHSGSGHGGLKFEGPAMEPGDVVRLDADLAPGLYKIECFVDGHDDLGMEAMLEVRSDAPLVREDPSTSADGEISIAGFAFAPAEVEVPVGTELTWSNDDPTPHTVTEEGGAFDSGTLDPGAVFGTLLDRAGTFTYLCQIHPLMRGTIRVVDP